MLIDLRLVMLDLLWIMFSHVPRPIEIPWNQLLGQVIEERSLMVHAWGSLRICFSWFLRLTSAAHGIRHTKLHSCTSRWHHSGKERLLPTLSSAKYGIYRSLVLLSSLFSSLRRSLIVIWFVLIDYVRNINIICIIALYLLLCEPFIHNLDGSSPIQELRCRILESWARELWLNITSWPLPHEWLDVEFLRFKLLLSIRSFELVSTNLVDWERLREHSRIIREIGQIIWLLAPLVNHICYLAVHSTRP